MLVDLTEADLDERRDRAVAAARTLAEQHGVAVEAPRVLHDLFSVVVHLAPAPLVVRMPTVLPASRRRDPGRVVAERRAELAVATALHGAAPQARPFLLEGLRGMLPVWRASLGT